MNGSDVNPSDLLVALLLIGIAAVFGLGFLCACLLDKDKGFVAFAGLVTLVAIAAAVIGLFALFALTITVVIG